MKNITLIALTIVVSVFSSCKQQQSTTTTPINAALLAAFNYKPGTYWIYRDSTSGKIDSFFVTNNYTGSTELGGGSIEDHTEILISEYNIAPSPIPTFDHSWQYIYQQNEFCLVDYNYNPYGGLTIAPLINYPYQNYIEGGGSLSSDIYDTCMTIDTFNSISLNGQNFTNAALIICNEGTLLDDWFYLCPSVGIFKMRLSQSADSLYHIWEIQRWHIVK